jgi:hypothetical protein
MQTFSIRNRLKRPIDDIWSLLGGGGYTEQWTIVDNLSRSESLDGIKMHR